MSIHFGTDGWRGIISADFTFDNLARLGQGVLRVLPEISSGDTTVVIGYDTRFMSREFAYFLADYLGGEVSNLYIIDQPCPTPVLSYYTKNKNAHLGLMITASHNPFYYNGVKFKMHYGGPPVDNFIEKLEEKIPRKLVPYSLVLPELISKIEHNEHIHIIRDFREYITDILKFLDVKSLQQFRGPVLYNAMHGSGLSIMPDLLNKMGIEVSCQSCDINPLFQREQPEPIPHLLKGLSRQIREEKYALGIATDGDGDRIGIFDEKGEFVDLFVLTALLYDYLIEVKKVRGGVAYSASLIDIAGKIAQKNGYPATEVPVGFKHVARKLHEPDYLMAAEESGGIGYRFHIPERDGVFTALLFLEMLGYYKKPVSEIVESFLQKWGNPSYGRVDFYAPSERLQYNFHRLQEKPPEKINNIQISRTDYIDGLKWYFEGGWVLIRISRTEPLGRIYTMASSQEEVRLVLHTCRQLLTQ